MVDATKSVSSTNAYPTNSSDWDDMEEQNCAPPPSERTILSKGVLTAAQICGPAPFPWPTPCMGVSQFLPVKEIVESP